MDHKASSNPFPGRAVNSQDIIEHVALVATACQRVAISDVDVMVVVTVVVMPDVFWWSCVSGHGVHEVVYAWGGCVRC